MSVQLDKGHREVLGWWSQMDVHGNLLAPAIP